MGAELDILNMSIVSPGMIDELACRVVMSNHWSAL